MKVAVASHDGTSISRHFGRSNYFIVFEFGNDAPVKKEIRSNPMSHFHKKKDHQQHSHDHSHESIIDALNGCSAVIAYGMGKRASDDLLRHNIQPCLIDRECTPYEAALDFFNGKIDSTRKTCACSHS